ncbi:hypothetical protein Q7P35_001668 [Cladosporium inversicolor]
MRPKSVNVKRAALQQYWHESGFTGIYLRATLRTLQFSTAIILLGLYGSELHHRSTLPNSPPLTNEIYALVVALLSVLTVAFHCFLTIKRVPYILWDFVMCVLYAALAGTFGGTYLAVSSREELAAEDRVGSLKGMKAGVAFDLLGLALWMLTFLQGSVWCCKARRFTRRTDVEEAPVERREGPAPMAERERFSSDERTLYAESMTKDDETSKVKGVKEIC